MFGCCSADPSLLPLRRDRRIGTIAVPSGSFAAYLHTGDRTLMLDYLIARSKLDGGLLAKPGGIFENARQDACTGWRQDATGS